MALTMEVKKHLPDESGQVKSTRRVEKKAKESLENGS
jgi:hypothetical protein